MKKILAASAVVALALVIWSPALAGHPAHRRGHGYRIVRTARVHAGIHLSFGVPLFPYYFVPAPIYYRPVPVIVAPAPCGFYVTGHYVPRHRLRAYDEDVDDD